MQRLLTNISAKDCCLFCNLLLTAVIYGFLIALKIVQLDYCTSHLLHYLAFQICFFIYCYITQKNSSQYGHISELPWQLKCKTSFKGLLKNIAFHVQLYQLTFNQVRVQKQFISQLFLGLFITPFTLSQKKIG